MHTEIVNVALYAKRLLINQLIQNEKKNIWVDNNFGDYSFKFM
jgi:hypothetical protein